MICLSQSQSVDSCGRFSIHSVLIDCLSSSSDVPRIIHGLYGKSITHISCGSQYSAAVTSEGELYTWGSGINGRLGHGKLILLVISSQSSFLIYCKGVIMLGKCT